MNDRIAICNIHIGKKPMSVKPILDNPTLENPTYDNQTQINKERKKKEKENIDCNNHRIISYQWSESETDETTIR